MNGYEKAIVVFMSVMLGGMLREWIRHRWPRKPNQRAVVLGHWLAGQMHRLRRARQS